MGSLEDHLKRTILTFKNRLDPKELVEIQCHSLSELNDVISQVQRRQRDQKSMMNLNRIKSFLEAMDQFEQTIKVFVNANDIVAFIWGPIKLLLSVANTWADAFDELLDAYEQIGEHMPLLQQYVSLFKANPHMQAVLGLIFDDITAYHNEAVRFFAKSVFKQVWRSFWKHHESRFRHLLDALVRHRKLIEEGATLVHFLQYQSDRERAQAEFKKAEEDRIRSMQVDVMRWLCSDDNKANYESHCAVRQHNPESGTWVLGDSKVKRWKTELEPVKPLLWLTGIPGAGKSVLASVIIEDCLQSTGADQKPLFATSYFFCSRENAQTTTCIAVLRGLIAQLLSKSPDHLFYCHEKFLQDRETMLTSMQRGKQLFDFFCDSIPRVCVVVDGLDECEKPERRALLQYLNVLVEKLHSAHPGKLRVLIASQQDGDIRKLLSSAEVLTLSVELNGEDIRAYVDYRLSGTAQHYGLPYAVIEEVANTTCAKASDMFLFARLVLDNLKDQPDQESFLAEIDKDVFPKDLSEAYARILKNIKKRTKGSDTKWSAAVKLLGWMANARRPMRWHEIQAASSIDGESSSLQYDAKKLRVHAQDLCGALILELPGQRLTLVHSTARTHIVRNEFINPFQVECNLTTLCLQYLAFPAFHSKTDDDTLMSLIREGQLAFHEYAVANFFIHFLELAKTGAEALTDQPHAPGSPQQSLRDKHSKDFDDFEHAFEEFAETHSLSDQKAPEEEMTKADHECRAFADWGFYSNLQKLWAISRQHANAALDVRNKPCLESIETTFTRGRELIEKLSKTSDSPSEILDQYYGGTRFKCNKVTCHWFNMGFANTKTRDDHVARHERPFRCEVTDCSAEDIGFKTSKQLEKHVRMFHPTFEEKGESFKPLKAPPPNTPYACHLCDKRFTRKFHLTSHVHNHNQEKPFACGQCGREFTRANDCRRHEKTIHSKRG